MSYQFIIMVYCIVLGLLVRTHNLIYIGAFLGFGLLVLALIPVYRNARIEDIKKNIKYYPNSPLLNVNRASWWEFAQLPEISNAQAKRMVWIRNKQGFYSSKEDFFEKNKVNNKKAVERLIYL